MSKARVAVLRTSPEAVLADHERLLELAEVRRFLDPAVTTILKDNISWHMPFPSANTTPWQLEGTIRALRAQGYRDLSCVQNRTVVTNAFKGEDLNRYVPVFRRYGLPVLYNFRDEDMKWVPFSPKAQMLVLGKIYPDGIRVPDYFIGKNIVHLPTVKCVAGDTEVVLADGSVRTIASLFEEELARGGTGIAEADGDVRVGCRIDLLSVDDSGRVRPATASWLWRTATRGRQVLRLRTQAGRTLSATADHRVRVPEGWAPLGELTAGARIATAARADIAWDRVAAIDGIDRPVDLYDVTVPATGCFVGNGLVVHNCHIYTTTTGAMKNAFGGLLAHHRHYTHTWIHETLVDLLSIQREIHPGLFAVMDGTTAGNGAGPRIMTPERKDVILASGDPVAIDAVAAAMMGFDPMQIAYIRIAHERGLGVGDPREIEVVGHPEVAQERWGFRVGMTMHRVLGWLSWYGPTRVFQKLLFRTPLVNIPIVWSEFYHDYYRWNAREKRVFQRWKAESPWGRLFAEYEARGTLGEAIDAAAE